LRYLEHFASKWLPVYADNQPTFFTMDFLGLTQDEPKPSEAKRRIIHHAPRYQAILANNSPAPPRRDSAQLLGPGQLRDF
jgi:hypothetical protein